MGAVASRGVSESSVSPSANLVVVASQRGGGGGGGGVESDGGVLVGGGRGGGRDEECCFGVSLMLDVIVERSWWDLVRLRRRKAIELW